MHRPEGACSGEERGKAPGLGEELHTALSVQSHSTRRTVQSTPGGTPAISILQSIAERGEGYTFPSNRNDRAVPFSLTAGGTSSP